ncbi:ribonuclease catalytic domain-containing protein [Candidatus Profftella armatura]|uniref:ribonuclease catalytic domain-containing protein n=1 Tax=Candidatus Profftella armatura TaxID=669502 RepID=UPI0015DCF893|nr:RNB domain-containing ribonuclease [Candidatus Profftella armatura]QLK13678.1 RNB domain-containing ribonuclease [Candidatus Profftella armatura]
MNLLFEKYGTFKVGTIFSQNGNFYQVKIISGRHIKVKNSDILLRFSTPNPDQLIKKAKLLANEIDLNFLWEIVGTKKFYFFDLGIEYFGHTPLSYEAASLLFCLHNSPIYFYKKGKGYYKAVPRELLKTTKIHLEKKKLQIKLQNEYISKLKNKEIPDRIQDLALQLLFKPDKNSIEYKALNIVSRELQISPERLMIDYGVIKSTEQLHYKNFLFHFFPNGITFPDLIISNLPKLPVADNIRAFSIDDASTTEIDDALSVVKLSCGKIQIGIHIAAPGLCIKRNDLIDNFIRERMSSIYIPGNKITMLPSNIINKFSLNEGKTRAALSLYSILNPIDWSLISTETRVEMVYIVSNLRNNYLNSLTEEILNSGEGNYPHKNDISILWKWAKVLEKKRMIKRKYFGLQSKKSDQIDFNFSIKNNIVTITSYKRDKSINKIISELMIFANTNWGKLISNHNIPGVYRAQGESEYTSKTQVRMITHPAPHKELGVNQYAWSTSPLRRYIDLVNQWQILSCIKYKKIPIQASFEFGDTDLFDIISSFDKLNSSYSYFQKKMERYWCLRWLLQNKIKLIQATVIKNEIVQLLNLPLVIRLPGQKLIQGAQVKLNLLYIDEINLTIEAKLL